MEGRKPILYENWYSGMGYPSRTAKITHRMVLWKKKETWMVLANVWVPFFAAACWRSAVAKLCQYVAQGFVIWF